MIDSLADSTLWTGTISFFVSNYLVLSVVSFIASNDLRFSGHYNATEKFCSLLAVIGIVFSFIFPISLFALFRYELRYIDPNIEKLTKISDLMEEHEGANRESYGLMLYRNSDVL